MLKVKTSVITGIITLAAGIVLILCNKSITSGGIIVSGGLLFVMAGVFNALLTFYVKDDAGHRKSRAASFVFNLIASAAAIALGVCMLVLMDDFAPGIPLMFGILVLFGSLMQFYALAIGSRGLHLPGWFYAFPGVVATCAVAIYLMKSPAQDHLVMILTGVSLIVFGLGAMVMAFVASSRRKKLDTGTVATAAAKSVEKSEIKSLD